MQTSQDHPLTHEAPAKRHRHQAYKRRTRPSPFLAIPNARTRDGKALRLRRAELIAHCGTKPTAVQATLIDRIVMLTWQSMQVDRLTASTAGQQAIELLERSDKLANTLGRCLARLGLAAVPPPRQSHQEWLASLSAPRSAA